MYTKSETVLESGEAVAILDVDIDEFGAICAALRERAVLDATERRAIAAEAVNNMFRQGFIPLIKRGMVTNFLFEKYGIEGRYLTVILAAAREVEGWDLQKARTLS